MNRLLIYVLAAISALLLSCRKDVGKVNFGNYPSDIGAIVSTNCAISGCHNAQSYQAAASFNMSSWENIFTGGSSTGAPLIPYNVRFSSLCYFINSYSDLGPQNLPVMPFNKTPLSHDDVKKIEDWISRGAPDASGNVWASSPSLKKLYATNQGCDVVTVFDSDTKLPVRYIPVGTKTGSNTPHQLKVSPDGQYWYVIFINNDVIQKFRCSDDSYVGTIPLSPLAAGTGSDDAGNWNTMAITKDSKRAFCVSWPDGKIAAVDLEHNTLLHFIGGQGVPHGIALNAAEDKFYVVAQTGNFVTEWDTAFTVYHRYSLQNGQEPNEASSLDLHELVLTPDNDNLLVTCQKTNEVRVFNLTTHSVTAIIPTGVFPQEIVYAKSTNQYFVSCSEDSTTFPGFHGVVTCINGAGYSPKNIKCGFQPHGIAVDEAKKLVYVLSRNISVSGPLPHHTSLCTGKNGFVNFIDLNTLKVLPDQYEMSVDPYYIFARP